MHVTYELTPDDFWRFSLYYLRHKHFIRPSLMYTFSGVMGLAFFGGTWAAVELWLTLGRVQWTLLLCLLVLPFFAVRMFPPTKGRVIKLAKQRPGLLCEHTIAISPAWFFEKTAVNETNIAWETLFSIEEDADYQFFFIAKANAFVIPKRAFSSLAEAQAFLDTSRRYWKAIKSGQPIPELKEGEVWPPPPRLRA